MTKESKVEFHSEVEEATNDIVELIWDHYGPENEPDVIMLTTSVYFAAKRFLEALDNPLITLSLGCDMQELAIEQVNEAIGGPLYQPLADEEVH